MTDYQPERAPEDNIDDMGDDEQADDVALAEEYVDRPPRDLAGDDSGGSIGDYEYERQVSWRGSGPFPPPEEPAEEAALHEEDDRET